MEQALIAAMAAITSSVLTGLFLRRKQNAEATEILTRIAMSLIEPLENKVKLLENKVIRFGERIIYLTGGIEILVDQITKDGKKPCWTPDEWNPNQLDE